MGYRVTPILDSSSYQWPESPTARGVWLVTLFCAIDRYTIRWRIGEKDYLNSKELYAPFKDIDIATLEDSNTGQTIRKAVMLPADTIKLLERIEMSHVALAQ